MGKKVHNSVDDILVTAVEHSDYKDIDNHITDDNKARDLFLNIKAKSAGRFYQKIMNRELNKLSIKIEQGVLRVLDAIGSYYLPTAETVRGVDDFSQSGVINVDFANIRYLDSDTIIITITKPFKKLIILKDKQEYKETTDTANNFYELTKGSYEFFLNKQLFVLEIK